MEDQRLKWKVKGLRKKLKEAEAKEKHEITIVKTPSPIEKAARELDFETIKEELECSIIDSNNSITTERISKVLRGFEALEQAVKNEGDK